MWGDEDRSLNIWWHNVVAGTSLDICPHFVHIRGRHTIVPDLFVDNRESVAAHSQREGIEGYAKYTRNIASHGLG